ncbi:uncharacterized protein LOC106651171 [Trichogramma pretiosum]|uniref:uncharacterized protein LOC106651171 n=1 Tax=Trichogramma pretiosum TaxID=7493 RepID=UPI0006C9948E|nr:uncharacterized protein LOC106651171 [Trichogramma pretiosum]XP_014225049.1 uncharacterized protein LOC106651171 [Trichogramma pretiosum]
MARARLKGWRFGALFAGMIAAVGGTLYFTAIQPMLNPEPYKQMREQVVPKLPKRTT